LNKHQFCAKLGIMKQSVKNHLIHSVKKDSIAYEMGVIGGDFLLEVNGVYPEDVFDYQFLIADEFIELLILKADGEQWLLEIDKDENEDLGIEFSSGLMDEYRSCQNRCIFCFIDQMPPGLRETLYFKDDDARLSFLQGNYITLTNLSDSDVDRIIRYHLAPINISIHTTDPDLRCKMLGNRFAGEALEKIGRLFDAGITMNGQIVLCKGINDGEKLSQSISDLMVYQPYLESLSVVPAGLTRYRDNLYPLEVFSKGDAEQVLGLVHGFQREAFAKFGSNFVYAADEWYLLAGWELPKAEAYGGYPQLANGVGMMRLWIDEVEEALLATSSLRPPSRNLSIATGLLAYPYIKGVCNHIMKLFPDIRINVYGIINYFFGDSITVSGLLTGIDILNQLKGEVLGERLLVPENVLRFGEDVFLDDFTVGQLESALQVGIDIVKSSGRGFVEAIVGADIHR